MHWSRPARAPGALYCAPTGDEVNIDAAYTYDAFSPLVLFALEQVELDEGPRLPSRIMGGGDQEIRIGQRVEAVFDDIDEELTLHGFRIVEPCDFSRNKAAPANPLPRHPEPAARRHGLRRRACRAQGGTEPSSRKASQDRSRRRCRPWVG